jgi:hypothetical protein
MRLTIKSITKVLINFLGSILIMLGVTDNFGNFNFLRKRISQESIEGKVRYVKKGFFYLVILFVCLSLSGCTISEIKSQMGETSAFGVFVAVFAYYWGLFILIPLLTGKGLGGGFEITRTHEHFDISGRKIGETRVGTGEYSPDDPEMEVTTTVTLTLYMPLIWYWFGVVNQDANGEWSSIVLSSHSNLNVFLHIVIPIISLVACGLIAKVTEKFLYPIIIFISKVTTVAVIICLIILFVRWLLN